MNSIAPLLIPDDAPPVARAVRPFVVATGSQTVVVKAPTAALAFIAAMKSGLIPTDADHIVILAGDRPLS